MKAFPHTYDQIIDGHVATCTNYGMDLRDWFAGYAMQALVNAQGEDFSADFIAEAAYEMANEMMKAREQ
jgi:hypothetical protein